ncbi:MAG: hypothetical protein ACN4GZ_08915 [Acidimicrobiales bacterium]
MTLLDDVDTAVHSRVSATRSSQLKSLLIALAVLLVPAAIAFNALGPSDSSDSADSAADDESGEPAPFEAAGPVEEFDELQAYGSGGIQLDNRYSEISSALDAVIVVGSVGDQATQPLQFYGPAPKLERFPAGSRALDQMSFDASGNWLAGVYKNAFEQDVLVVGKLGGDDWVMDPVAVRINGYAWHPTDPGVIAFAKLNTLAPTVTDVVVEDYTQRRVLSRRFRADFPGRLRLWGEWGMAFDEPGPIAMTTVATYDVQDSTIATTTLVPLVESVPGLALGELGINRILIDGADQPTIVNTDNAVFEQNVWVDPSAEVVTMSSSPDGNFSVALVVGRGSDDSLGGKVLLLAADPTSVNDASELLFATAGPTAFDWTPDGRFVAGFEAAELSPEGERRSPASVTVYDLDRGLFVGREIRELAGGDLDLRFRADSVAFQETLNG